MSLPTDLRLNVPQYSPEIFKAFPRGDKNDYPRMMTHMKDGKHVPYTHANGKPVIVESEKEEAAFYAKLNGTQEPQAEATEVSVEGSVKRGPGRPRKLED